jgi:hypothetical protein
LSAPFDFDFEKLNIGTAQRQRGDILATRRISIRDGSELVSALWGNLWGIFEKSQQSPAHQGKLAETEGFEPSIRLLTV